MRNLVKKILIFLMVLTLVSFVKSNSEQTYSLIVKAEGFRNSNGEVLFALYNEDGSIPDEKYEKYFKKGISQIDKNNTATFTFVNLPKGNYAINVLHDENKNGKIDKKFMLPMAKEGIGFSNYETIGLSNRPKYSKASFELDSNMAKVIKVIYM